jgi:RNA polymerase sigma-70 factor (ECF subfamily)
MDADADLMLRVARGETDAFRALVERFERPAYNFFLRLAGNSEDAEDLTQELFILLFRTARKYRPEAPFKSYFYRIASNLASSHRRKGRIRASSSIDEMMEGGFEPASERHEDDPQAVLDARETRRRYEAALAELPRQWRIAMELRVARELSYEEIAVAMDKSVAAVESMLFRARERLAEALGRPAGGKSG